jgi:hypothetical protein
MIPRTITLPCGRCTATWSNIEGQYLGTCHCPPSLRRQHQIRERQAIMQRAEEARKRSEAPLSSNVKPFHLLKGE